MSFSPTHRFFTKGIIFSTDLMALDGQLCEVRPDVYSLFALTFKDGQQFRIHETHLVPLDPLELLALTEKT